MEDNHGQNTAKSSSAQVALGGMVWTFAERISAQLVTLIVSIILARLLSPDEYAIVAIVTVFVTIANVFVTAGFGSALVQKLNTDNLDFSTTLYFSIGFAVVIYAVLFFTTPLIAKFYEIDLLVPVLRVMALRIIIAAVNSVQQAYVAKTLQFKKFFYSTIIGTVVSAVVGIGMAYAGFGVWALVGQYLTNVAIGTVVLAFTCGWKPEPVYSWERMKGLYSYGWRVMAATVFHTLGMQIRSLALGKVASPKELSFYNQGERFPALFINNIETSIQKVMAPILAREQKNVPRVLDLTRKAMQVATFTIWPLLIGLAAVAESLIELLYTEKWMGSVPYLKLVCVAYLFYPVGETHVRTIRALGRSDVTMRTVFGAEAVNILFLIAAIVLGSGGRGIVISWIISSIAMAIFNGVADRRITGYGIIHQIKDLVFTGICCVIMYVAVNSITAIHMNLLLKLTVQILVGLAVYALSSLALNRKAFFYVINTGRSFLARLLTRKH